MIRAPLAAAGASILIVDDEPANVKALCDVLGQRGFDALGCPTGELALTALSVRRFDILLTDLAMPGMDGIALLRAALNLDQDLVGVIMTGEGSIGTAVEAMQNGAIDYVLKPCRLNVVLPVLSRALSIRGLRVANRELEGAVRERTLSLEAANRALELANRELEAFSYSVSHDLRAPLRSIDGFSRVLLEEFGGQLPDEARALLGRVTTSAAIMGKLIEDLLHFARVSRQPLSKQTVDVDELVSLVVAELCADSGEGKPEVRVGELPPVEADRSLLRQVFANLLSNAVKFRRSGSASVIEVGCASEAAADVYFVRDNGVGFDMKYKDKLFGVFQRLHSREEFDGTGVGLSIVQRIVERHGGRIWADAIVGQGAAFYFTLEKPRIPVECRAHAIPPG